MSGSVWLAPPSGRNGQAFDSPTFTGVAKYADGSKTAPSIAFTSSPTDGIYWRASNFTAFANANIESAQIASTYAAIIGSLRFASGDLAVTNPDAFVLRAGANSLQFGGNPVVTTTARTEINKAIASIADNTATDTFTVTIPNAAHSASIMVLLTGSLGAGGAIGANEASASIGYNIAVTRTAGVNAVATISAAFGSAASAAVAGAATITVAGTLSAISGAVGATNTFTIKVTIARGSGTSTNHTCFAYAKLLNANATGITIA